MPESDWRDALLPSVATLANALASLDATGLQLVVVVDGSGRLEGTLSDGDVRRALLRGANLSQEVREFMNSNPVSVEQGADRHTIVDLLRRMMIRAVPIIDASGRVQDFVTLDELLRPQARGTPAVIMAGGRGKRLRPITDDVPKPLVRVAGEPLIDICVRRLVAHGFSQIWVAVHYRATDIQNHLGDGSHLGARVHYVLEREPQGTAGSARDVPVDGPDVPILICNVDTVHAIDLGAIVDYHEEQGAWVTLAVSEHVSTIPYGVVSLDNGRVTDLTEKPRQTFWVAAGVTVVRPRCLSLFPADEGLDVPTIVAESLGKGLPVAALASAGYWLDVGDHSNLDQAQRDHGLTQE